MIFKRWSGWSKYYRCWIIPAGKTCRSLNLTKRFPFTHYNIPWLHLILTVMIPYMKYYTSIPNQLPFVEKNFPYWKMSLQNLGQECWDGLCVGESLVRKKIRLKFFWWQCPTTHIQHYCADKRKRVRISVPICLSKLVEPAKTATGPRPLELMKKVSLTQILECSFY